MAGTRKPLALCACAAAALMAALSALAAARADAVTSQSVQFHAKYSKRDRHKSRGGLSLRTTINITDPAAPAPLQLAHTTLRFPKGATVNARYFPKCKLAALRSKGPSACPKGSKLGSGRGRGAAPPIIASVDAKITLYNGELVHGNPSLIIYTLPDIGPILTLSGVLKPGGSSKYGYILDMDVPPIKTLPSAPDASVTFFDATVQDRRIRRRGRTIHYIDSPVLCNGTFFLLDGAFSYQGGVTNTVYEEFTLSGGPSCR
jgi:hypothetical protein